MWKWLWALALTEAFVLTESLFNSVGFPPTSQSSRWMRSGWRESSLTSCLLRLKPDFHSLLQKMALSAGSEGVWPVLQTQIAVSLLAVAAGRSPAPLPRQLGTVGVNGLWLLARTELRWAQTSCFSLTHQELCFYKSPNVTGNGQQMSYDAFHQNTFEPYFIIQLHISLYSKLHNTDIL